MESKKSRWQCKTIISILFIGALSIFQPTVHKVVERINIYEVLSIDQIESVEEIINLGYVDSFDLPSENGRIMFSNYQLSKLSTTSDLLKYDVYRVSYEWSFFSVAKAQLLNNNSLLGQKYEFVWWTIGDSNSRGNSDAAGITPAAGTVKQWDNTNGIVVNVGASDMLEVQAAGTVGSQWPQAGSTFYELTGQIPIFVNTGIGGSAFFNPTAGFSWYTNDAVFTNSLNKLNNCLNYLERSAPDAVWIEMGINDVLQGHALDQVYLTSLIDRILAEFPGVRICISEPWSSTVTTYANLQRLFQVRKWIKALCFTYPTVEIAGDMAVNTNWSANFQADNVHRNALGNGFWGDKTMYGICQSLAFNKWTRSVTGIFYSKISATRVGWLNTYLTALDSNGDLELIDQLSITSTAGYTDATNKYKNAIQDIGFISSNQCFAAVANFDYDGYHPQGLIDTDRIGSSPLTLIADKINLSTNFQVGIFLGSNAVGATTASAQRLVRESVAGALAGIRQNGSNQIEVYAASASPTTDGTETRPANGYYAAVRDGANQKLVKNTTEVDSDPTAATAFSPGSNVRGLPAPDYNNNGTIQNRWAGVIKATIIADYQNIDQANVVNSTNAFLADWLTNVP
jgi:hypothetical protein